MWFGTEEGLNRFDGYDFKVFDYDPDDPTTLRHAWVRAVAEDAEGTLWVGTEGGGLSRFDPATGTFSHYRHEDGNPRSLSNDRVRVLYLEPRSAAFWVGTDGGGLNRFDPEAGTFEHFRHDPSVSGSLSHDHVRSVLRDSFGILWVGTEGGGLNRFDEASGAFRSYRHDASDVQSLSDDRVRVVFEDRDRTLWVGTYDGGLNRFDRSTGSFVAFRHDEDDPSTLAADGVRTLFQDRNGSLWVGTDGGLAEWRPATESFVRYRHDPADPYSLSHDTVVSILQDQGGVLWVGTYGGLNRWNTGSEVFQHYRRGTSGPSQLSNNYVTSFTEGPEGWIWLGTYGGGLNRFDRTTGDFRHFLHDANDPRSLSDDRVMALLSDREGTLWVGTTAGGLNRLDPSPGLFEHYRQKDGDPTTLSSDGVTTIFEDSTGKLWVGTYRGGLNLMDKESGTFQAFRHDSSDPASLSIDRVLVITEDASGVLWVGTDGGGLNRLDSATGTFVAFRKDEADPASLSSDHVWTLVDDEQGNLWVGTQGGGLNRWSEENRRAGRASFRHYTKRSGLPSGIINATLWDSTGKLWIGTDHGLSKFDPATEALVSYDAAHGLQSDEFNFAAALKTRDGQMFFGGINGFNTFYPDRVQLNSHVPPVVLTRVLKLNQEVNLGAALSQVNQIELSHKDRVVAFEYAALDYAAPENNQYRYKLEGFDAGWVNAGTRHRATYTNLEHGQYVFRVQGSNNDGVWNRDGIALTVNALPPPWRTGWAYALYALGFGVLGFVVFRSQARKLEWAAQLNVTNEALQQEVAERRAKEEALHQEKRRAQQYLDVVEVIMVALDEDGCVTLINGKGCRVLGLSEKEILGRNWFESFVAPAEREKAQRCIASCDESQYSEFSLVTGTGQIRDIAWHTSSLPKEAAGLGGVICSGTDVTQIHRLKRQLHLSQKMDAIGTLAGGIAHDFNNILQSILGFTAITLESLPPGGAPAANLRRVVLAGERARKLIGHILTFSQGGHQDQRPILAQSVLREALELLRPSIPSTLEIRLHIDSNCRPILADPTQVHQVVMNLCTNAYQAVGSQPGVLTIALEQLDVDAEMAKTLSNLEPGPTVRLTVEDTGRGMSRETMDRIFDPFFTTRGTATGTGLGLSVVHGIVRGMRGQIAVTSEPGLGAIFRVYIPCCEEGLVDVSEEKRASQKGREKILVVDDEVDVANMMRIMLENMGYRVAVRTSGIDALKLLSEDPSDFDLLLTDQTMPKLTGTSLAQEAKALRPSLAVVVISGFLESNLPGDWVDVFLQKPFVSAELGEVVRACLDQRSKRAPSTPEDGSATELSS